MTIQNRELLELLELLELGGNRTWLELQYGTELGLLPTIVSL